MNRILWLWIVMFLTVPSVGVGQTQPLKPTNDPYFKALSQTTTRATVQREETNGLGENSLTSVPFNDKETEHSGIRFEPGEVVAIVGGEPILVGDMLLEVSQILEQFLANAPQDVKDRERRNVVKLLIPKYVDSKLLFLDTVKKLPEKADVNSILEQAAKDFDENALPKILEKSGAKSPTEYDAALRSKGSSLRQMRMGWAREQLTSYFVNQNLKFDKDISHEQLLAYFHEHQQEYHVTAKARWEELMVRFDRFPTRDAAFKAVVEMGNEVVYGAKLEAVAKRSSHGITASSGGQFDWVSKGSLVDQKLEEAVFTLPLNELSELIETKNGVHIIRVLERQAEGDRPFVQVQSEIKEKLVRENRTKAIEEYLAKLRKDIPVEIVWKTEK